MNNGQKQKNIVVVYTSLKVNMKMQNAINHILNRNVASHKVPIVVKNANSQSNLNNYVPAYFVGTKMFSEKYWKTKEWVLKVLRN